MSTRNIMCLRSDLIAEDGFFIDYDILDVIDEYQEFLPREELETDPTYRQVIPYILCKNNGRYLSYERHGNEDRLHNMRSIGIGGHIDEGESLQRAAFREIQEEIRYRPSVLDFKGCLALDTDEVSQVHLGIVFVINVPKDLNFGEELLNPEFVYLDHLIKNHDLYELWSQEVITNLLCES